MPEYNPFISWPVQGDRFALLSESEIARICTVPEGKAAYDRWRRGKAAAAERTD